MDEQNFPNIFEEENEPGQNIPPVKRLEKSRSNVIVSGLCSGIAKYTGTDPSIIRIAMILSLLIGIWSVVAYFVAAMLIPLEHTHTVLSIEEKLSQKKINFRTVLAGLMMLSGFHFGLVSLGFSPPDRIFLLLDSFLFPFIAIVAGLYYLSVKADDVENLTNVLPDKYYRSISNRRFMGVCGGFAKYMDVEATSIRIIFLIATMLTLGVFAMVYLLFAILTKMEERLIENQ